MTHTKTAQFNILQILFWVITTVLFVSTLFYGFFISTTVSNVVERTALETRIAETSIQIGELESVYMELRTEITPILAESLGFNETENVVFAVRGLDASGLAKLGE